MLYEKGVYLCNLTLFNTDKDRILDTKTIKKPLRFSVQDIYEINNKKIIAGKVVSGILNKNQQVLLLPSNATVTIKSLNVFGTPNKIKAYAGESMGISLNEMLPIKRGDILVQQEKPPMLSIFFKGNIFWLDEKPLEINRIMVLHCSTQQTQCIIEKIEKRINPSTLDIIEKNAKEVKFNETALIIIKTDKPILIEKFSFIEEFGRFVIEKDCRLAGIGIIL